MNLLLKSCVGRRFSLPCQADGQKLSHHDAQVQFQPEISHAEA